MPLLHRGPTAQLPASVLARLPQTPAGERVGVGTYALSSDDASEDTHLVIEIDEFIGWWTTDKHVFKRIVKQAEPDRITLRISSPGGFVDDALAIHDFVKDYAAEHGVEVTVLINGLTASAATMIACCASPGRVFMSENALYLVHLPWGFCVGHWMDLERAVKDFQRFARVCARIYERKTGLDRAAVEAHLVANNGNGEWWEAETALENGYVDAVYEPGKGPDSEPGSQARRESDASAAAGSRGASASALACAAALRLPQIPAGFTATPAEEPAPRVPRAEPSAAEGSAAEDLAGDRLRSLHASLTRCLESFAPASAGAAS